MRPGVVVLSALLAIMLPSLAMSAVGAVDWTYEVSDPQGDVHDDLGNIASGREDIDILSVHLTDGGSEMNVTLKLAGHYNTTAGYTVDLLVDRHAVYVLTWRGVFAAKGPSGAGIVAKGDVSRDGTVLSWVIAKSYVPVTAYLWIDEAEATLTIPGAVVCTDTVKGAPPVDGELQMPKGINVRIVYKGLNLRDVTITVVYEGANASTIRGLLDSDGDGILSSPEVSLYENVMRQRIERETGLPNSTLDGKRATNVTYGLDIEFTPGNVTGPTPLKFTMTQALEFPLPQTRGSHVYVYETAIGGDEPWDNKAFGDDPWGDACIGGDEPWDNIFFGGVVPWGAQAIGGDEPWDNVASVTFRVEAPEGWTFATEGWPAGMKDLLNEDGDVLEMDAEATASSYATTVGRMNMLTFEEQSNDGDGGFIPSYGATLALVAVGTSAMLLAVRRGRAPRM